MMVMNDVSGLVDTQLRILFLTLEFSCSTFSGNGIYAQSQVRALSQLGHTILVVSAKPQHATSSQATQGAAGVLEIPVSTWGSLDASSPWQEYESGVTQPQILQQIMLFLPEIVLAVDWSAYPAFVGIKQHVNAPLVYLNYRIFSRTAEGADLQLIQRLEAGAMQEAALTVVLSTSDQQYLLKHVAAGVDGLKMPQVLLPPLREDLRVLPAPSDIQGVGSIYHASFRDTAQPLQSASSETYITHVNLDRVVWAEGLPLQPSCQPSVSQRQYLTCCVRLSKEKEPHRFVELVTHLAANGALQHLNLVPLMVGSASDEYATELKLQLKTLVPEAIILEQFLGPAEMAHIYSQTRLNFHPSVYDAYGMTIVEAASQGAPSVVHDGNGAIGATDLLDASKGEVLLLNLQMDPHQLADCVATLLANESALAMVGKRAFIKARSWTELANAAQLTSMIASAIQ